MEAAAQAPRLTPLIALVLAVLGTRDSRGATLDCPAERRVLGKLAQIECEVSADGGTLLEVTASTGTVAHTSANGPGRWRIVVTPPDQLAPGLLLLAARIGLGGGETSAFAVVPLIGAAVLPVKTEAHASVTVTVDGLVFGPVLADLKGRAPVPIEVAPGTVTALARSVDPRGHASEESIRLPAPPATRLWMVAPAVVPAGHSGLLDVLFVTPAGAPDPAPLTVRATTNAVTLTELGVTGAVHHYQLATPIGLTARRRARLELAGGGAHATLEVALDRGPAARIVAEASPTQIGYGGRVTITAHALDAYGNPAQAVPTITGDAGTMTPTVSAAGGASAELTAPMRFAGHPVLHVQITAPPAPPLLLSIPLQSGPATLLRAQAPATAVGGQRVGVVVTATDAAGAPVEAAAIAVASGGQRAQASGCDAGGCRYQLVAPRRRSLGDWPVTASSGPASALVSVLVYPAPARLEAVPMAFLVTNFGALAQLGFAGELRWRPRAHLLIGLEPGVATGSFVATDSQGASDVTLTQVPLLARVGYEQALAPRLYASAAATAGLDLGFRRVSSPGEPAVTRHAQAFVAGAAANLELLAGPGRAVLEAAYLHARLDDAGLASEALGLRISLGYAVALSL